MPTSYKRGKKEIVEYLTSNYGRLSKVLDVGPGKGTYWSLLHHHFDDIDACEIHKPYIEKFKLHEMYSNVHNMSIMDFPSFEKYDIVLMGDILEHLTVKDAQRLLERMSCVDEVMIAVPFEYHQGAANGVESERHLQPDLTHENFMERYPGFVVNNFIEGTRHGKPATIGAYYVRDKNFAK